MLLGRWHATLCNTLPKVVKIFDVKNSLTVYLSNDRYKNKHFHFLKRESGL